MHIQLVSLNHIGHFCLNKQDKEFILDSHINSLLLVRKLWLDFESRFIAGC